MDHIQLLQCMDVFVLDYLNLILLSTLSSLLGSNAIPPLETTIRGEVFTSSSKQKVVAKLCAGSAAPVLLLPPGAGRETWCEELHFLSSPGVAETFQPSRKE